MKRSISSRLIFTGLFLILGATCLAQDKVYLSSPKPFAGKLGGATGSSVIALEPDLFLVAFTNGNTAGGTITLGRVMEDSLIVFADSVEFAPAPGPGMISLSKLSETSFLLSFTLNDRIYVRPGEVVDKALILLGGIQKMESGPVSGFAQVVLSDASFLTTYYDGGTEMGICTLGTIGENLEIRMDSSYQMTDAAITDTTFFAMDSLSASSCVISYGSSLGKSMLVSINEEHVLSFGSPYTFASNQVHEINVVGLRNDKFALVYDDASEGKRRGSVILGTADTSGTISYSDTFYFDLEKPSGLSAVKLLPWEFVISYNGGWNDWFGYVVRARIAGDSVSFVNRVAFNAEPGLSSLSPLAAFDGQDFLVTYLNRNTYKGYARLASTIEFGRPSSVKDAIQPSFKIYPNPASDVLHIRLDSREIISGEIALKVIDLNGRTVLSFKFHGSQTTLDLSKLHNGLYLLQLGNGRYTESHKLIVE